MHSIRLRHPWRQLRSETSREGQILLVCYGRAFNSPTGLEPQQSVLLVVRPTAAIGIRSIALNDRQLQLNQSDSQTCAELTDALLPFNQLEILVELAHGAQPPLLTDLAEVCLEIA